jgi:hypothetical protein
MGVRMPAASPHVHGEQAQPYKRKRTKKTWQGVEQTGQMQRDGPQKGIAARHRHPGSGPYSGTRTHFDMEELVVERSAIHCT